MLDPSDYKLNEIQQSVYDCYVKYLSGERNTEEYLRVSENFRQKHMPAGQFINLVNGWMERVENTGASEREFQRAFAGIKMVLAGAECPDYVLVDLRAMFVCHEFFRPINAVHKKKHMHSRDRLLN